MRSSVTERRLDLPVDAAELAARAAVTAAPAPERGYARLHTEQILQADAGCDFAVLRPKALRQLDGD